MTRHECHGKQRCFLSCRSPAPVSPRQSVYGQMYGVQGYFAHKKQRPLGPYSRTMQNSEDPRTLQ